MDYLDDDDFTDSNENQEQTSTSKKDKSFKSSIYKESNSKTSLSSFQFGKKKLKRVERRFIKYKKAFKLIKNINIKINCVFLNELTKFNNKLIKDEYDKEMALLNEKKFLNVIKFYNKIREIINSNDINEINKFIFQNDFTTYNIKVDNPNKEKSNKNLISVEDNKTNKANKTNLNNTQKEGKISPIKNFWKLSLINCQFFKINKMDGEILNFLKDIIIIPFEYPNFRIEFHFKKNDYLKQNILTKEYFYTNSKKEKLLDSRGTDIEWGEDNMNPTLKSLKKIVKDIKVHKKKKIEKIREEDIYVNTDSFFKIFDIDKSTIEKDFIESSFFINDFFPNILEYYLNIIEIRYDNAEDELISNN